MYAFNPFYSTVNTLRMCTLVLCVVDSIHISNLKLKSQAVGLIYLGIEMVELTARALFRKLSWGNYVFNLPLDFLNFIYVNPSVGSLPEV